MDTHTEHDIEDKCQSDDCSAKAQPGAAGYCPDCCYKAVD